MRRWRVWIAAISLSNLVYLRSWAELFAPNARNQYWFKDGPAPADFIAQITSVLLLAVVVYALGVAVGDSRKSALRVAPLFGLLILMALINSLRTMLADQGGSQFLQFVEHRLPVIGVIAAIVMVTALLLGGVRSLKPVYRLLILVSPFVLFTFGEAIHGIVTYDPSAHRDGPMAARLPAKPPGAPRVVWVIFDEWDYDLTFPERPSRIAMPETDRLVASTLSAGSAIRANTFTEASMAALTTGIRVDGIHGDGPSELVFRPSGSTAWIPWSRQETVFRKARQMGFNTAVVAWALPYCRVLKADLSDCWWWNSSTQSNSNGTSVPEMLLNQPRSLFENLYRSPFGQSLATRRHRWVYDSVLAKALEVVRDPSYGLILLHLPIPHYPFFYNAATGRNDWKSAPITGLFQHYQDGYLEALALTDRTLGAIRNTMEQAGTWNSSTLVFSADHPYRFRRFLDGKPNSDRVPYIVKAAGAKRAVPYTTPFNAMLTKELILAFLSGELAGEEQVPGWLDAHRSDYPVK